MNLLLCIKIVAVLQNFGTDTPTSKFEMLTKYSFPPDPWTAPWAKFPATGDVVTYNEYSTIWRIVKGSKNALYLYDLHIESKISKRQTDAWFATKEKITTEQLKNHLRCIFQETSDLDWRKCDAGLVPSEQFRRMYEAVQ